MRALWRTRRSFAARGHCNRFGWRSLGFRKMGEPGAFSSGGWHVPKSGQSFESPATPLTNYCCCCSETKKKEKKGNKGKPNGTTLDLGLYGSLDAFCGRCCIREFVGLR